MALKRRAGVEEQCPLADFCYISGAYNPATEIEAFHYFKSNFQRYSANKAPFGLYSHSYWFGKGNHVFSAYLKFVDYLLTSFIRGRQVLRKVNFLTIFKMLGRSKKHADPIVQRY